MITPIACAKVTSPALTKPITVRMAAVEDWISDGEDHARRDGAEPAGDEPLERAAQRVAREILQAFGEVVDPEQEHAEPTEQRHDGGGVHRARL